MADAVDTKAADRGNEAVLKEARARFKEAMDADAENRIEALDDLKFAWNYKDYQWPQDIKRLRKGRPCLTENRLPQFIRQIVNTQRQNRPSIKVSPVNSSSDPQVAEVIEGMIRHIEQWSKADLAYDNAFEWAVTSGVGYFRITTEYIDEDGFDQDICIRPIDNAFSVYDDPHYSLPDASDRRYSFVTELVDKDEFEAEYGFMPASVDNTARGDDLNLWWENDRVRVAEYWRVRTVKSTAKEQGGTREREVEKRIVEQFLMTGDKIIKKSDWAGVYIPIIPVFGETKNIEGRKLRKSLIRDAKDSQRINNYWLSTETELVALQPRAPYIGPVGAFETDEQKWANSNAENHAYLQYDPVEGGMRPERQQPPEFPSAVRETRMAAIESMKAIMGVYDASLGARSNETSGVAISERQQQGDQATYHFIDNMVRAIRYGGTAIIDLMPKVYDAPRVARIISPDGEPAMVAINYEFGQAPLDTKNMRPMPAYNVKDGRYDVVVKAGPSYQTQREESAAAIRELIKAYPPIAQLAGDLLLKNMDFPGADEIAKRLQAQQGQHGVDPAQMQALQQHLQQAGEQVQTLTQQTNEQKLQLMGKDLEAQQAKAALQMRDMQGEPLEIAKLRMQLESNERIAAMNNAAKTNINLADAAEAYALQNHLQQNENVRKVADVAMSMADHAHQDMQAQRQASLGIATKQMDHTFTAGQSEAARAHEAKQQPQ